MQTVDILRDDTGGFAGFDEFRYRPMTAGLPPLSWSTVNMSKTEDQRCRTSGISRKRLSRNCGRLRFSSVGAFDAIREIGVVEQTYYRWRKLYGGMGRDQVKELKRLQKENERLRRAISDLTLDKLILSEAARGNF